MSRWKAMDDEAKKPFTEQAAADKTRYETEMAKYTPPADAQRGQPRERRGPPPPPGLRVHLRSPPCGVLERHRPQGC